MAQFQNTTPEYQAAHKKWSAANLSPLWENTNAHKLSDEPEKPLVWHWADIRPLINDALAITDPVTIERRVLTLSNPNLRHPGATLATMCVALQSLLPGETARPHRHSMNAIRLLLEGNGAETIVDGKACLMEYGDLVLTPGWTWHEHKHNGSSPVIWLDALDVPLHEFIGTSEFQPGPINAPILTIPDDAFAQASIVPEGISTAQHSPVFRYPYKSAAMAVGKAPRSADGSRRVRYINPITGGSAMAMLDCSLIEIDRETPTTGFRTNAHSVYCVVEGEGTSTVSGTEVSWKARDIIAVPPGNVVRHQAESEKARLFVVSDRDLLSRLDLLKEVFTV